MLRHAGSRFVAKATLSLALLAGIVVYVSPRGVLEQLAWMSSTLVGLAFVLLLAESFVRATNWFQLMHGAGYEVRLGTSTYAYFAGGFLGALFPSSLTTDLARSAVAANRTNAPIEPLLATTALLNLLSLAVIGATGLAACGWLLLREHDQSAVVAASIAASIACALGIIVLRAFTSAIRRRAPDPRGPATGLLARLHRRGRRFADALLMLPHRRALLAVTAVAVASYLLRSLGWLTVLSAADVRISWVVLLSLGPLVTLGAALPISMLGFGGIQAVNVFLLAQWGVPAEQALAASLVQSGLAVLMYGVGCGVYLGGSRTKVAPLRAPERADCRLRAMKGGAP